MTVLLLLLLLLQVLLIMRRLRRLLLRRLLVLLLFAPAVSLAMPQCCSQLSCILCTLLLRLRGGDNTGTHHRQQMTRDQVSKRGVQGWCQQDTQPSNAPRVPAVPLQCAALPSRAILLLQTPA
jgi:hypothetical protein